MKATFRREHSNRSSAGRGDEILTGEVVHISNQHMPLGDQKFDVSVPGWLGGHTVAGRHLLTLDGVPVSIAEQPERATAETVTDEQLITLYNERDRAVAERDALVEHLTAIAQVMVTTLQGYEQGETEETTDDA